MLRPVIFVLDPFLSRKYKCSLYNMLSFLIALNYYVFVMILSPNVYINVNMHANNMDNFNGPFGVCCAWSSQWTTIEWKELCNSYLRISTFVFPGKYDIIWDFNNTRMNKWWHNCNCGWTIALSEGFVLWVISVSVANCCLSAPVGL